MTDTVVGIDIGGTSVRAVALDLENNEVKDQLTASSSDNGPELIRILSSVVTVSYTHLTLPTKA